MLFVHGSFSPLRLGEEIRFWKTKEREHAALLRSGAGGLSQEQMERLPAWEKAFGELETAAHAWLNQAAASFRAGQAPHQTRTEDGTTLDGLAACAAAQSQQWVAHVLQLAQAQPAAEARSLLHHIARDSEYFLGVLNGPAASRLQPEGTWSEPVVAEAVPIGGHTLPPLPYAYDALEPHIDAETIRIHHDILHKNYVEGLNHAEQKLAEARQTGDFSLVKHWERELAFHGAGHYLHTVYFFGMSPQGGGRPSGELLAQITRDFGSFDAFKQHFSMAAKNVEGSGWAHLVWSPRARRLEILQAEKHQNLTQWEAIPLLSVDVWEHSYYLQYKNERAKYIEAWFQVVNWPYAAKRFQAARTLRWKPF